MSNVVLDYTKQPLTKLSETQLKAIVNSKDLFVPEYLKQAQQELIQRKYPTEPATDEVPKPKLQENPLPEPVEPFNPRVNVSADAEHIAKCASLDAKGVSGRIVKHLWIIFVLLPVVLGVLFSVLTAH